MFKRRALSAAEVANRHPGPPWTLYFESAGKRNLWSLKFADIKSAVAEAKLKLDLFYSGREAELRSTMVRHKLPGSACSTFADVWNVLDKIAIDASPNTRISYQWGARSTFALALDLNNLLDVDRLPLSVLDKSHAAMLFAKAKIAVAKERDQAKQAIRRRNVLYAFQFTRSLFSPLACESMRRDFKLVLPDTIEEFRKSIKTCRFKAPKASRFEVPDQALLRLTFRKWLALGRLSKPYTVCGWQSHTRNTPKEPDAVDLLARRNMFIAVGLALSCGLRKNEVAQIKWGHLMRDADGRPRLVARDVHVKKGSGELSVRPLDPFYLLLLRACERNGWKQEPGDYVLAQRIPSAHLGGRARQHAGGACDRTYWPFYHVSCWLRGLGWRMQKTNHALRDLAGSLVTMKFGLERAKLFCRHDQIATTESHYGRFVSERDMDDPQRLRWLKWAVASREPVTITRRPA